MAAREDKRAWRQRLRAARREQSPQLRAARGAALAAAIVRLAEQRAGGDPVCAYLPVETEPAWASGLDGLRAAGHEVLLPVVPAQHGPLDWARYDGPDALGAGPRGLGEPLGPRLGAAAIARAGLVLVPALAVDRSGVRLGQGGGYYDMTLPLTAAGTLLVAVLNDEELVDELPAEPHDYRLAAVLLPTVGLVTLTPSGMAGRPPSRHLLA